MNLAAGVTAPISAPAERTSLLPGAGPRAPWSRRLGAGALLLLAYVALSWVIDPHGRLGADTGGKLATLETMAARDTWVPEVGYWAAGSDRDGLQHPLHYTLVVGDGDGARFVNVTTVPMVLAARPLYEAFGIRGALLLPMIGAVVAAAAASGLARRLGAARPGVIFWAVGMASPLALYALDFWEHTWGVALVLVGVNRVLDALPSDGASARIGVGHACAIGVAFGAAAVLRTEALVYAAVALLVLARAGRGDRWERARAAGYAGLGVVAVWWANDLLERALLGAPLRSGRTADVAAAAGAGVTNRLHVALTSLVGTNLAQRWLDLLIGGGLMVLLVVAVRRPGVARIALVAAALLVGLRWSYGLSLVPGATFVAPAAVCGAAAWGAQATSRWRAAMTIALGAVPLVWLTQYVAADNADWGPRYLLPSVTVLAVVGLVALERAAVRGAVVALCAVATVGGIGAYHQRSAQGAATGAAIERLAAHHDVVISRLPFLFREVGTRYRPDARWLNGVKPAGARAAARMATATGAGTLVVIDEAGRPPAELPGFRAVSRDGLEYFGRSLGVTGYRARSAAG